MTSVPPGGIRRNYTAIALVGGQATGKSTLLHDVRRHFGEEVVCVEEVARAIRRTRQVPPPDQKRKIFLFQRDIYRAQCQMEEVGRQQAELHRLPVVVIDRSMYDGLAYLEKSNFYEAVASMESLTGLHSTDWGRYYDTILYLPMPSEETFHERRPETQTTYATAYRRGEWIGKIWENHIGFKRLPADERERRAMVFAYIRRVVDEFKKENEISPPSVRAR